MNGDTLEALFVDIKELKQDVAWFKQDYSDFKDEVRQSLAQTNAMGTYTNDFFPADDNEDLERFMCKDKNFEKRREALYLLISGCASDDPRKFVDSMITALFSKNYLSTYIWPYGR